MKVAQILLYFSILWDKSRHDMCINHNFFTYEELDVLLHHVLLEVHQGHGGEIGSMEVHIDHIFEFLEEIWV